jgi:hypothetical protein
MMGTDPFERNEIIPISDATLQDVGEIRERALGLLAEPDAPFLLAAVKLNGNLEIITAFDKQSTLMLDQIIHACEGIKAEM